MLHNKHRSLALALVLATATVLVGCSGSEGRQAKYLERAQELIEKNDLDKARIELKNVLQINASNAEARYLLAELDERDRNWPQMYANLNAAIEADPKMAKARNKMAQLFIASSQLDKADEALNKVLEQEPNNADAFATRAIVRMRQQKPDEAIVAAEKALQLQPGHISATAVLAGIYQDRDPAKAEQILADGLKANPNNVTLQLIQVQIFNKQNKTDAVIGVFKNLIAQNPDNLLYPSQLANFYIGNNRVDDAEAVVREFVKQHPDNEDGKLLLVELLTKQRSPDIALTQLEQFNKAAPDSYKLRSALARFYTVKRDIDKAIATYQYTIDKDGRAAESIDARNRIVELQLAQNKRTEADALIKEILELEPENAEALLVRARLALAENKPDNAIADLRTVLKNSPDSPVGLAMLASAQERTGARSLALDSYQKLLQLNPDNLLALTGAARLQMAQNQLEDAQKLLERAHKNAPADLESSRLLVDLYSRNQDWDQALRLCNDLLINQNSAPIGHYLSGLVYMRKQELPKAIEAFRKSLDKEPRAIEPLQMLVNAQLAAKQGDQAIAYLEKHLKTYPDQVHAQELLGALYRQTGKLPQAERTLSDVLEKQPARTSTYRELAAVYALQKQPGKIEALFKTGIQKNPNDTGLMLLLAEFYQTNGKNQEALDSYNKLHELLPQSPAIKNNLAVLLIEKFPTEENLQRAQSLTAEFADSDNPMFMDTLGWLQYKMKNYPQSIAMLENAVRKTGDMPELRYHLGMAYLKNNMPAKAKEELAKATQSQARFDGREEAELTLSKL
jgi:cellulose synthase operon protein C